MSASTLRSASALALTLALGACRSEAPEPGKSPPLETVELAPAEELDLSADPAGRPMDEGSGGVLPEDFPSGLPVLRPSTVSDLGTAGGGRYVELETPDPPSRTGPRYRAMLEAAGWRAVGGAEGMVVERQGRRVRIGVQPMGSGTRIRIEY